MFCSCSSSVVKCLAPELFTGTLSVRKKSVSTASNKQLPQLSAYRRHIKHSRTHWSDCHAVVLL